MRRLSPVRALLALAAVVAVVITAACGDSGDDSTGSVTTDPAEFAGYVRSPALQVSEVTLPAADGSPVNMAAAPGGLRLVYFGYTFCPDVCPTTMAFVKRAFASLSAEDRGRVQVDMVTIDPARDSAEKLTEYVTTFVPDGSALRSDDPELLRNAARAFGADYKVSTGADGEEEVSHTGDLYVVDDTGTVILAWPFGTSAEAIERDLGRLLVGQRPPTE
jgi:protein SCO1/2